MLLIPRDPRIWLLAALLFCGGCQEPGVLLVVDVRTDLIAVQEMQELRAVLEDEGRRSPPFRLEARHRSQDTFRIAEWAALAPSGRRLLRVEALAGGEVIASRSTIVLNRAATVVTIVLTRNCSPGRCAAGETCLDDQCVAATCLTGAEPECSALTCDSCSPLSACDEAECESNVCFHRARAAACELSEICRPDVGCVEPMGTVDGGLADAGPGDAGRLDAGPPDGGVSICRLASGGCDFVLQDCPSGGACRQRVVDGVIEARCERAGVGTGTCSNATECRVGRDCIGGECVEICCPGRGMTECAAGACAPTSDGLAGYCLSPVCDVFDQRSCPDSSEGCYVSAASVQSCLSTGGALLGAPCVGVNDCAPGLGCASDMQCRTYCSDPGHACGTGEVCFVGVAPPIGLCVPGGCNPVTQTGCPAGSACYPVASSDPICWAEGTLVAGETCSVFASCRAGLSCAGSVCRALCDRDGSSACTCDELFGVDRWGVCR